MEKNYKFPKFKYCDIEVYNRYRGNASLDIELYSDWDSRDDENPIEILSLSVDYSPDANIDYYDDTIVHTSPGAWAAYQFEKNGYGDASDVPAELVDLLEWKFLPEIDRLEQIANNKWYDENDSVLSEDNSK